MWYLIVPPLIFLGCLWLLLFFLSRRVSDPQVQEELAHLSAEPSQRILFFKEETGLRILEKVMQRFKVRTLQMHNTFNNLSQSLRRRRQLSEEQKREREAARAAMRAQGASVRWNPFRGERTEGSADPNAIPVRVQENSGNEGREQVPVAPKESRFSFKSLRGLRGKETPAASVPPVLGEGLPVLRRHTAVPDKPKRLVSEEDLIEKIAKNPKDAVAYEELGDYYMETNNLDDAKACYRQVIKLSPFNRPVKDKVRKLERLLTQKAR